MARWRTLNKRARRKREREVRFTRNTDEVMAPALEKIMADAIKAAFTELSNSLQKMAVAWVNASNEWGTLSTEYTRLKRQLHGPVVWPDVILADLLDAEYLTEE